MAIVNWSDAPKDAVAFGYVGAAGKPVFVFNNGYQYAVSGERFKFGDGVAFREDEITIESVRPTISLMSTEWPETDERINNIGLNRTTEDMGHYDEQREQYEQAQPAAPQANKYDRTIIGKYGSGKCTVDVYRVLNAFPSGSPEIDHSIKKLLAPGKRGVKSELQDLREAIQSIEARISYLSDIGEK